MRLFKVDFNILPYSTLFPSAFLLKFLKYPEEAENIDLIIYHMGMRRTLAYCLTVSSLCLSSGCASAPKSQEVAIIEPQPTYDEIQRVGGITLLGQAHLHATGLWVPISFKTLTLRSGNNTANMQDTMGFVTITCSEETPLEVGIHIPDKQQTFPLTREAADQIIEIPYIESGINIITMCNHQEP